MHASENDRGRPSLTALDLFLLWAGAAIALPEIWAGGLVAPLGLAAGLAAILLGHAIGTTPMALAGLIGSRHDLPAMIGTRGALGRRGSHVAAALNALQMVGWTAVMLWIGGQAAAGLAGPASAVPAWAWIAILGALTTVWAMVGGGGWRWLQRLGVGVLLVLSAGLAWLTLREYGAGHLIHAPPAGGMPFTLGLDLVIAMPVSWLPLVSDYTRFARSPRGGFAGTWTGYFAASSAMYAVGLLAALATGSKTPDAMVIGLMATAGWGVPALLIVVLSTVTTTFLNVFSNAMSVQSIFPRLSRRMLAAVTGAVGSGLAIVLPMAEYEGFLLLVGSLFCPLFGVVLADYFILKRGRYDAAALAAPARAEPCGGFNPAAFAAWAAGIAIYHWSTRAGWLTGASVPSMLLAAAAYLGLMRLRRTACHAGPAAADV